jgi:hypothetical protein
MPFGLEKECPLEHSHLLTFQRALLTYWQKITTIHVMAGGKSNLQPYSQI